MGCGYLIGGGGGQDFGKHEGHQVNLSPTTTTILGELSSSSVNVPHSITVDITVSPNRFSKVSHIKFSSSS
jgi:hypothetical protein